MVQQLTFDSKVEPCWVQSFPTFDSMERTLKCHHSLESCWAVINCGSVHVCFSILPVCNLGTFINFGLGTISSERVNTVSDKLTNNFFCYLLSACQVEFLLSKYFCLENIKMFTCFLQAKSSLIPKVNVVLLISGVLLSGALYGEETP